MTLPSETPQQAYNRARAETQKRHTYTTDGDKAYCACDPDVPFDVKYVGTHIEQAAEAAGVIARNAVSQ